MVTYIGTQSRNNYPTKMGDNSGLALQIQGWAGWFSPGPPGCTVANARLPAYIHVFNNSLMNYYILCTRPLGSTVSQTTLSKLHAANTSRPSTSNGSTVKTSRQSLSRISVTVPSLLSSQSVVCRGNDAPPTNLALYGYG